MDYDTTVHTEEYKGFTITIHQDTDATSPRDWDNLGTLIGWDRDRISPDHTVNHGRYYAEYNSREAFAEWLDERAAERRRPRALPLDQRAGVVIVPIEYSYHASSDPGRMWAGSPGDCEYLSEELREAGSRGRYDSPPYGYAFVTYEKIRKEYKGQPLAVAIPKAIGCLKGEIQTYSDYIEGNVYGFVISDDANDHIDSCWGFFPDHPEERTNGHTIGRYTPDYTYCLTQAKEAADDLIANGNPPAPSDEDCESDMEEEIEEYAAQYENIAAD